MAEAQEHSQLRIPQPPIEADPASEFAAVSMRISAGRVATVVSAIFLVGFVGTLAVSHGRTRPEPLVRSADLGPAAILMRQLRSLDNQHSEQALTLHMSACRVYREQGQYANAVKECTAARDVAARLGGSGRLGESQQALGLAHYYQGKLQDARRDLEAAFVLVDGAGEHAASTLQAMGNVRREMGHLDEALKLYKKAWEVTLARGDHEHLPALASDFGDAYTRRGDIEQATAYFHQATKQRQDITSRLHSSESDGSETAMTLNLLGNVHHLRGDIKQAMDLYRKAMRMQSRILRSGHPDLVSTQISIARAQRDLGDSDAALDTVTVTERTLRAGPKEGLDLSRILVLKADLFRQAKQYQEAEAAVKEAMAQQLEALGSDEYPEVAVSFMCHGSILHDQENFMLARDKYARALAINLKTFGSANPETAASHNSLGTLYQDSGSDEQAREHFAECLKIQLQTVGPSNPDVAISYNNLATIQFRQGKPYEAIRLLRKAIDVLDAADVPKGNPDREIYEENLVEALQSLKTPPADRVVDAAPDASTQLSGGVKSV